MKDKLLKALDLLVGCVIFTIISYALACTGMIFRQKLVSVLFTTTNGWLCVMYQKRLAKDTGHPWRAWLIVLACVGVYIAIFYRTGWVKGVWSPWD